LNTKNRAKKILAKLKKEFPNPNTELKWKTPFQLLTAVILSAQCTDKQVNKTTHTLFKKLGTAKKMSQAKTKEIEKLIHSTGFYHTKAKNIKNTSKKIMQKFKGKVPSTIKELITLPGVARKTANVVLAHAFNKTEGIAVDTHVKRITNRLGFTKSKNPTIIERNLMDIFPPQQWVNINILFVLHGRKTCTARKPKCKKCPIKTHCPSSQTT
jgi:endonuclease III